MVIVAKFPGKCASCGGPVRPGDKVEWSKGQPARHVDCQSSADRAATDAAFQKGRAPDAATDKQLSALRRMLSRLERVQMFDSFSGNGADAAEEIRAEIRKAGGLEKLTRAQVSKLIDTCAGLLDDEM